MPELDPTRASSLIERFASRRLLVVGDVMLDRYVVGEVDRISPEAPVPILRATASSFATGGAGNAAKNAAALGATATLVGVAGADAAAAEIAKAARAEGYAAVLVEDTGRPTIEKMRFLVGGRQILRVDREESAGLSPEIEKRVAAEIAHAATGAEAIVVSDYDKGFLTPKVADAIHRAAAANGIPVLADVKPAHIGLFRGVAYISPNRKEACGFLGPVHGPPSRIANGELAAQLRAAYGAGVFLTLGADGIFVHTAETPGVHVPQVHRVDVADTSGCGDTAAVAIVLAKLSGASDLEAAWIGNAAGAVVASKVGAVAPKRDEILRMLSFGDRP
jgi:D-beta-D-heptose 7-phosphate kinase/D-beta-D-heptose 1-phosphate adenosyltransferase